MTDKQFCWQIVVQIASVVATLILAAIAIWGKVIRAWLVGPKLTLSLDDPEGTMTQFGNGTPVRYYHLKVSSERRSSSARNVRVMLTGLARPAADGQMQAEPLSGPIQLLWQHHKYHPQFPTIGANMVCDLGYLPKSADFELSTGYCPNNVNNKVTANQKIEAEITAFADEAESNPLRIEVAWDGAWSEDTMDMKKHLVVKKV